MGDIIAFGDSKETLRQRIMILRECMTNEDREKASYYVLDSFFKLPEYQNAEAIFAFAGFGSEVSTLNAVFKMINSGKKVSLPRVIDDTTMEFFEVRKISDIQKSSYGIPEPRGNNEPVDYRPDIIIMPGVAFDRKFNRLGYGKGYYDRYLRLKGYDRFVWKIALGFSCQVVHRVPVDKYDVAMDMVITEKDVIR